MNIQLLNTLEAEANQAFYDWEDATYPEGSPLSDEARHMFVIAYRIGSTHQAEVQNETPI